MKEVVLHKDKLAKIVERINGHSRGYRQNVAVLGWPASGKTYLLYQALKDRPENVVVFVCDLANSDKAYFNFSLLNTIVCGLLSFYEKDNDIRHWEMEFEEILSALGRHNSNLVEMLNGVMIRQDPVSFMKQIFNVVNSFLKSNGLRGVMVFEHFDRFETLFARSIFSGLSEMVMLNNNIMFIVTSSSIEKSKRILKNEFSLLFGNFEVFELKNVSFEAYADFMDYIAPDILNMTQKRFIYHFTGGNPLYIKLLLERALFYQNALADTWAAIIRSITDNLFLANGPLYQRFFNMVITLTNGKKGPSIPMFMVLSQKEQDLEALSRRYGWEVATLEHKAVVLQDGNIATYDHKMLFIDDRMLAFWVKNVYRFMVENVELDSRRVEDRAARILKQEIALFIEGENYAEEQKIINLFRGFGEKFIQFPNGKKYRFYVFTDVKKVCDTPLIYRAENPRGLIWYFSISDVWDEGAAYSIIDCIGKKKAHRIIVIGKKGFTPEFKVIAKERGFWLWDVEIVNHLLFLHKLPKVIW